jgi:hypothetical protein
VNYGLSHLRFTGDAEAFPFFIPSCLAVVLTAIFPSCLRLANEQVPCTGCCGLRVPTTVASVSDMIIRAQFFVHLFFFFQKLIPKSEYCTRRRNNFYC